jgi:flagellar basal-body rod protein FlgF
MPGGIYSALSGMRLRLDDLDRIAADLANTETAGYKTERTSTETAPRAFQTALDAAIDATRGGNKVDFRPGTMNSTGRDLDVAIEGKGFFEIQTPAGVRYTRGGNFVRDIDGRLTTADGFAVMGTGGEITLPVGPVTVMGDGNIRVGQAIVGKLKVMQFASDSDVARETGTRFKAADGATPTEAADARLRHGMLEHSNASVIDRMATMTEVMRSFEMLQKGISVLMNDVDLRAINELGKK